MGRLGTALFAALHLAQASWLLHGGFDLLFPRVLKVVAATADDRCAPHGCGCEEEVRKRHGCCCGPSESRDEAPAETRGSAVEAARCAGVETAMAHAAAQPSVCERPAPPPAPKGRRAPPLPRVLPPDPVEARALDKVPL